MNSLGSTSHSKKQMRTHRCPLATSLHLLAVKTIFRLNCQSTFFSLGHCVARTRIGHSMMMEWLHALGLQSPAILQRQKIILQGTVAPIIAQETFLQELLHCILKSRKYKLISDKPSIPWDLAWQNLSKLLSSLKKNITSIGPLYLLSDYQSTPLLPLRCLRATYSLPLLLVLLFNIIAEEAHWHFNSHIFSVLLKMWYPTSHASTLKDTHALT